MDIQIRCQDCNKEFPFTVGQQYFYQSRGFTNPKRCPRCKSAKKELHQNISDGFKNHRVSAVPKNAVICAWCGNPCHSELHCRWKERATCSHCGRIGYPTSVGMARGIRTNSVEMACKCNALI
ncbi:hypothetical protein HDV02_001877 [Globomyces sp. JEL0801]|nr:hypothetical protein HDV02_001877 [Globomyces sp. JEL0801]